MAPSSSRAAAQDPPFIRLLKQGKAEDLCNGREGLRSLELLMELLIGAYRSARDGRTVHLPLEPDFSFVRLGWCPGQSRQGRRKPWLCAIDRQARLSHKRVVKRFVRWRWRRRVSWTTQRPRLCCCG
ncbi:hypothetical protein [Synechococcus sp. CCY9202]|uniref:hypothetical protein n=1 Tax=Synechococcus sp. CCY9202 TaxID=174698 RepID=UPI002B216D6C|nr:hypothetical protein [Synechococcus sp. CCY9202]MEA5423116.1 hypothetical protein [Synechococcus sp. CCY9202]